MKNHIALAIALALGSTFAIAGDKHKSDSTSAPSSEQSADQAQPKSGEAMKEGAAGAAGPESSTGVSGAASGDAAGASTTTNAGGEATTGDSDKEKKQ